MRYDTISGEEVLMYSRYEGKGNGSSVYMVKTGVRRVLSEHVDAYPYTGGIIGNDAEDHLEYEPAAEALAEMKLTPYKGLSSEPIIRYLYTGREYNIETGDYYYRARIYDQSVGRFGGKDNRIITRVNGYSIPSCIEMNKIIINNIIIENKPAYSEYTYVGNSPLIFFDPEGLSKESSNNSWLFKLDECINRGKAFMHWDEICNLGLGGGLLGAYKWRGWGVFARKIAATLSSWCIGTLMGIEANCLGNVYIYENL